MSKRLIIPNKATVMVSGNTGALVIPDFSGYIRYLAIEGPSSSAKGRVRVRDVDLSQDIFRDPRATPQKVSLEFYTQATDIPVNGVTQITIDNADNGSYIVYYVQEERPRRV